MNLSISSEFLKNMIRQMVQVSRSGFGLSDNSRQLSSSFSVQKQQAQSVQHENRDTHKEAQIILQETDVLDRRAEEANEVSREGREKQQNYLKDMETLAESIRQGSEFLEGFKKSSDDISRLTQMIVDISSRLDVLSINGAIEAARRGEAGLGFSVITREMKNLSQETAASAERVDKIIKQFDRASTDLRSLFLNSQTSLQNSRQEADGIYKTFLNIEKQNKEMAGQVKSIRTLMESLVQRNANREISADKILSSIRSSSDQIDQISRESQDLHAVVRTSLESIGSIRLDWHDKALAAVKAAAAKVESSTGSFKDSLKDQFRIHPFIELLYVLNEKGVQVENNIVNPEFADVIDGGGEGQDRSSRSYFSRLRNGEDSYISDIYLSEAVNHLCLTISVPFRYREKSYVLAADMNLEGFVLQE